MDAVKFYSTFKRMCAETDCKDCLLDQKCRPSANVEPEEVVELVEEWAKEHPIKTRQSEFLKMFPNAKFPNTKTDGGVIIFCPRGFLPKGEAEAYCEKHDECIECCKDYWLAEVNDND
jgi:hypothetical protein